MMGKTITKQKTVINVRKFSSECPPQSKLTNAKFDTENLADGVLKNY